MIQKVKLTLADKYEFIELIGKGGSAEVFKALDRNLNCYVAIKCYVEDRFSMNEIKALKELNHGALPNIMDYIEAENKKYLIMEYIEGISLEKYIRRFGTVRQDQAIEWVKEIAEVLNYLHKRNEPVIYQDLKPANIMIDSNNKIKLIDFGSTYFKHQEEKKDYIHSGTIGYAAPEQFDVKAWELVDERSDIYSLGVTFHYMLTGSDPSLPPYLLQPLHFYNIVLSSEYELIIKKATNPQKEKRYQSMIEILEALKEYPLSRKKRKTFHNIFSGLYYLLLIFLGTLYLNFCRQTQLFENIDYQIKVISIAFLIILLCLIKIQFDKKKLKAYGEMREIKSIYLSAKKGRSLLFFISSIFVLFYLSNPQMAAAKEEKLHVVVRNEHGQKLLIHYDSIYKPSEDIKLELPLENFTEDEKYILTVDCTNTRTKEKRSRTFYLQVGEP